MLHGDACGIVEIDRAGDQDDVGAGGLRRRGNGKTLFAGGAVGDVAHRIDRLVGGPRGDQHAFARQRARLRRPQKFFGGGGDFRRLRHPADAGLVGFGHLAGIGPDHGDAVAFELRDIAAGRGVVPHQGIHRRRQQDRPVGREQNGAGEIVGMALRHLGHQVGGRRRHHDQVAVAAEPDMAGVELARGIEQVGVGALVRQRAGGKRRDELLRGAGQHAADVNLPLLQPPDQVQRLVGGDAAADDQGDARQVRRGGARRDARDVAAGGEAAGGRRGEG